MATEDRGNLMTEKRMRRGMSQQIARGNSHQTGRLQQYQSVGNSEDRQMKQQLKHTLGKVNLLASGDVVVNEEEKVRSIYLFLSALGR